MTQPDDYDDTEVDDQQPTAEPNWRRQLERKAEKAAREAAENKAAAEAARRELAFVKAGVDPDSPKAKYFVRGYEGELTVDAIKAEAAQLGLVDAPAPPAEEIPAAERAAHERIAASAAGTSVPGGRDWNAEMAQAAKEEGPAGVLRIAREKGTVIAE